jgi:hypothetical protein
MGQKLTSDCYRCLDTLHCRSALIIGPRSNAAPPPGCARPRAQQCASFHRSRKFRTACPLDIAASGDGRTPNSYQPALRPAGSAEFVRAFAPFLAGFVELSRAFAISPHGFAPPAREPSRTAGGFIRSRRATARSGHGFARTCRVASRSRRDFAQALRESAGTGRGFAGLFRETTRTSRRLTRRLRETARPPGSFSRST